MIKISIKILMFLGLSLLFMSVYADEVANKSALSTATTWLVQQQNQDGSWGIDENIRYPYTSAAVDVLRASSNNTAAYYAGIAWLENHGALNVDSVSRKISSLTVHGNNIAADLVYLSIAKRDVNQAGWGLSGNYTSSALDSAIALGGLITAGNTTSQTSTVNYLLSVQKTDGGWSIGNTATSDYWTTANVYTTLTKIQSPAANVVTAMSNARNYLTLIPNTSNTLPLAQTAYALYKSMGLTARVDELVNILVARQASGGWGDAFTTATTMRTLVAVLGMENNNNFARANITDPTLRAIINAQLGKNSFDNLTVGELLRLTSLNLSGTGVITLAGLEGATNLRTITVDATTNISAIAGISGLAVTVAGNRIPVAVNDVVSTDVNLAVTINVLANDTDADGNVLAVSSANQGAHGSVSITANDDLIYAPNLNYSGTDTFSYSINDGAGGTASAMVTVTITPSVLATGDVNGDLLIDVSDVILVQQHVLGAITLTTYQINSADIYPPNLPDGVIDISDLILLERKVLEGQ